MKLIHTGDLHIGKVINGFSMLNDQEYILDQIIRMTKEEQAQGIIIAGDVYDRAVPTKEAVELLDQFLSKLVHMKVSVFMISGNHDSPERLSFANSILEKRGLYIAGSFDGKLQKVSVKDEYGTVNLYLLPFIKPALVRMVMGKEEVRTYEESVKEVLNTAQLNQEERNILVTHHFITNCGTEPESSDSETRLSLGGTDNIEVSVFDGYDYVALGHIHGPQKVGRDTVRYSGSPLKYSFSEVFHKKSVTVIELKEKGQIQFELKELKPLHDVRKIKGELKNLISKEVYAGTNVSDYIQVTLTNKEDLFEPLDTLRAVYPSVMQLIIEKNTREEETLIRKGEELQKKTMLELFRDFYESVTESDLDETKQRVIEQFMEEAEGGEAS